MRSPALALLTAAAAVASTASAQPQLDMLWTEHNGAPFAPSPTIFAAPGDTLRLEIRLDGDFTTNDGWDLDLLFDAELDAIAHSPGLSPTGCVPVSGNPDACSPAPGPGSCGDYVSSASPHWYPSLKAWGRSTSW